MTIQLVIALFSASLFAQWTPVNNGLDNFPPTTLWPFAEEMVLGTDGGGLYKTADNGENWVNISGNLGNLHVNDIRGFNSLTSMFVATEGGPFVTMDMADYTDCTSTGLSNTDINYFWWGNEDMGGEFMVGTNGDGVFGSDDYAGPWLALNNGLSGDALIVNDMGGYSDGSVSYTVMATDGGTYWGIDNATVWEEKNNGLSGEALKVKRLAGLGTFILAATHGGLYYTLDLGESWISLISDEKLNTLILVMSSVSPTGFMCLAFGENGFYSEDFMNWTQLNMGGLEGEVMTAHANSTHVFLGVTTEKKVGKESGGVYRKPLDQILVGIEDMPEQKSLAGLDQNYPNPFNTSTKIAYSLESTGFVSLKIYDIFGKVIQTIVNESQQSGDYIYTFNKGDLQPSTYFYSLEFENKVVETKRMVVLK
ncbi:MAG: T9SS type A sorting domain-containing protein [Bacteroidales bacterium]